jgi:hypothetical protein
VYKSKYESVDQWSEKDEKLLTILMY